MQGHFEREARRMLWLGLVPLLVLLGWLLVR